MARSSKSRAVLDPAAFMQAAYESTPREFAFRATNSREALAWQKKARPALADCIGFLDQKKVPLNPKVVQTVDRGSYVRRKVILHTTPWSLMPVYVLTPKNAKGKLPCVLTLHGHGYGVKDTVGLWEDNTERWTVEGYHMDFAAELAKQGFLVIAPEISCFGERVSDYKHLKMWNPAPRTCHNIGTFAMMLGGSVVGVRVWDTMRAVDYLETIKQADTSPLGAMGISGGGMHTFFSAALDPRIKACVISGYFSQWRQSILSLDHCTCNFVPGLLKLGELSDLAGLIAPRPCLIENADRDQYFPLPGVEAAIAESRKAWKAFGKPELLEKDIFEGRHTIHGVVAYEFLKRHLTTEHTEGTEKSRNGKNK